MELGLVNSKIDSEYNSVKNTEIRSEKRAPVGILGYGNYGKAVAARLEAVGVEFVVGTRDQSRHEADSNISFMAYEKVIEQSEVIFLAIPFHAYTDVVSPLASSFVDKIVIDVSNADKLSDQCNAEFLADLLPSARVVKAFNTISAWSMENDVYGASRCAFICGNDATARLTVMQLAREMGFNPFERGRLHAANALEKKALQLFPEWRRAFWVTLIIMICQIGYMSIRGAARGKSIKYLAEKLAITLPMISTGWMTLWLLALTFLPGCIAGIIQITRGTKYSVFPNWLDRWLKSRKQFGLFALMFASMHACITLIMLAGGYFKGFALKEKISGTDQYLYRRYHVNIEVSMLFATISTTLMGILGITSLPSVNQNMSWKEWDFIQSKLGYASMLFGFLHVALFAYVVFDPDYMKTWTYGFPHSAVFMLLFPFIVFGMKLILIMPGVNGMLQKIRKGWERGKTNMSFQQI